jgi:hypothetical protein
MAAPLWGLLPLLYQYGSRPQLARRSSFAFFSVMGVDQPLGSNHLDEDDAVLVVHSKERAVGAGIATRIYCDHLDTGG